MVRAVACARWREVYLFLGSELVWFLQRLDSPLWFSELSRNVSHLFYMLRQRYATWWAMMGGAVKNTPSLLSLTPPPLSLSFSAYVQLALAYQTSQNCVVGTILYWTICSFYDLNQIINMVKVRLHSCIFKKKNINNYGNQFL